MIDVAPDPLVSVQELRVTFHGRRTLGLRRAPDILAVDDVTFSLGRSRTLGVVGESGAGKSTLGRALLGLSPIATGTIIVDGMNVLGLRRAGLRRLRRSIQLVYQDPYSSLNPKMLVRELLGEPLFVNFGLNRRQRDERAGALLELVGLSTRHLDRYPDEFSGGQRQRIGIARALSLEPAVIVCDEALSSLDVSTQAQIINLLEDLQAELGVAYVMISHDLAVVRHISHDVAVMYLGRLVEYGSVDRVCDEPLHPYTQALLAAVPVPDPQRQRQRRVARRSQPVPAVTIRPSGGCPYAPRCPLVIDVCRKEAPRLRATDAGHAVACHRVGDGAVPNHHSGTST